MRPVEHSIIADVASLGVILVHFLFCFVILVFCVTLHSIDPITLILAFTATHSSANCTKWPPGIVSSGSWIWAYEDAQTPIFVRCSLLCLTLFSILSLSYLYYPICVQHLKCLALHSGAHMLHATWHFLRFASFNILLSLLERLAAFVAEGWLNRLSGRFLQLFALATRLCLERSLSHMCVCVCAPFGVFFFWLLYCAHLCDMTFCAFDGYPLFHDLAAR